MSSGTDTPKAGERAAAETAVILRNVGDLIRKGTFPAVHAIDVVRALQWLDAMSGVGAEQVKVAKAEKKRAVRAVKAVKAVPNG